MFSFKWLGFGIIYTFRWFLLNMVSMKFFIIIGWKVFSKIKICNIQGITIFNFEFVHSHILDCFCLLLTDTTIILDLRGKYDIQ